jgi:hypothetical protein
MEELRLLLLLLAMIAALVIGARPVVRSGRVDRTDPSAGAKRPAGSVAVCERMVGRNRWDRPDLARAIGRDELDWSATTALWPASRPR